MQHKFPSSLSKNFFQIINERKIEILLMKLKPTFIFDVFMKIDGNIDIFSLKYASSIVI